MRRMSGDCGVSGDDCLDDSRAFGAMHKII